MTRKNAITLLVILAIFGFALWAILPVDSEKLGRKGLHLGLDLVGGVHLVYEADATENATELDRNMKRVITTIQKRIDKYGVAEPVIQQLGDDRVLIQLPGFTDIDAAKSLVEQTGFLEFREVELTDELQLVTLGYYLEQSQLQFADRGEPGDRIFVMSVTNEEGQVEDRTVAFLVKDNDEIMLTDASGNPADSTSLQEFSESLSWIPATGTDGTHLTGDLLSDAAARIDQSDVVPVYVVSIQWNSEGAIIFDQIASKLFNAGEYGTPQRALGIFLDNSLLSAPQIRQQSYQGSGQIEGSFTPNEAEELANLLKSGALPMPLKQPPLYQEKVSATLGANFIEMSWMAGLIGIVLVMLFMIAYYRIPGLLASLALIFYVALVMALFKLIPVTLTLAGLGGFILSIGMAVDANVLIFERMKEELRLGRTLGAAIEAGFNRAWSAIRDSNVTTIIVCVILFWLGSSIIASAPVMGFALTLGIGVIISMFTAILVTRTLLRLFIHSPLGKNKTLFIIDRGKK
ncbi:MAG: protein translocase subunit SecD, partial [Dehalococcoidales bacterium]|nr:protein translocase subunit SecD [Dehalococcoidales bacterium]